MVILKIQQVHQIIDCFLQKQPKTDWLTAITCIISWVKVTKDQYLYHVTKRFGQFKVKTRIFFYVIQANNQLWTIVRQGALNSSETSIKSSHSGVKYLKSEIRNSFRIGNGMKWKMAGKMDKNHPLSKQLQEDISLLLLGH